MDALKTHPVMQTPLPYGYGAVEGGLAGHKLDRNEDMAVHNGESGDAYAGSRVRLLDFSYTASFGAGSEPQHVIEARFHSGLTLVQYVLPRSETIQVYQCDGDGARRLGTIEGNLRVPSVDPACFPRSSKPLWLKTTGPQHHAEGREVVIEGRRDHGALTQVIHPNGTISVFSEDAQEGPPQPFVTEDEIKLAPWMRTARDQAAPGGVSREGATVSIGGLRLPVRQA